MGVTAAVGVWSATAGTNRGWQPATGRLVGTWEVVVNRPAPLPPLRSLQVFTPGGTAVETSNENPATRSPLLSAWKRIGGRLYAATGKHFIFNPQAGDFTGWRKIDRTIEVARDGQSFVVVGKATTFDAQGNPLGTIMVRATAQRMPVDEIPERP